MHRRAAVIRVLAGHIVGFSLSPTSASPATAADQHQGQQEHYGSERSQTPLHLRFSRGFSDSGTDALLNVLLEERVVQVVRLRRVRIVRHHFRHWCRWRLPPNYVGPELLKRSHGASFQPQVSPCLFRSTVARRPMQLQFVMGLALVGLPLALVFNAQRLVPAPNDTARSVVGRCGAELDVEDVRYFVGHHRLQLHASIGNIEHCALMPLIPSAEIQALILRRLRNGAECLGHAWKMSYAVQKLRHEKS